MKTRVFAAVFLAALGIMLSASFASAQRGAVSRPPVISGPQRAPVQLRPPVVIQQRPDLDRALIYRDHAGAQKMITLPPPPPQERHRAEDYCSDLCEVRCDRDFGCRKECKNACTSAFEREKE